MAHFTQTKMREIIEAYDFRSQTKFNNDPVCLNFLISYLSSITISSQALSLVIKLIQFYKFPILICFQPFYSKLTEVQISYYSEGLQDIYQLTCQITKDYQFEQLEFFQKAGKLLQKNETMIKKGKNITKYDIKFMQYANKISKIVNKIKNILIISQSITKNVHSLHLQIDYINEKCAQLSNEMNKALQQNNFQYIGTMILQNYYIKYMQNKFNAYLLKIKQICERTFKQFSHFSIQQSLSKSFMIEEEYNSHDKSFIEQQNVYEFKNQQKNISQQITDDTSQQKIYEQIVQTYKLNNDNYLSKNNRKISAQLYQAQPNKLSQYNKQIIIQPKESNFPAHKKPVKKFSLILPLCCRQQFTLHQPLIFTNIQQLSYYNIPYIYDKQLSRRLKQDICSMLNNKGGNILLGVRHQYKNKVGIVQGIELTEQQKQNLLTYFRYMIQDIQPDILYNKLYQVCYIPVKNNSNSNYYQLPNYNCQINNNNNNNTTTTTTNNNSNNNNSNSNSNSNNISNNKNSNDNNSNNNNSNNSNSNNSNSNISSDISSDSNSDSETYIAGLNIIKIKVKHGIRDQVYSYKHNQQDHFSFRNQNGPYYLQGRNLLKVIKQRFHQPLPIPLQVHEGPCQKPYKGNLLYTRALLSKNVAKMELRDKKSNILTHNNKNSNNNNSNNTSNSNNNSKNSHKNNDYIDTKINKNINNIFSYTSTNYGKISQITKKSVFGVAHDFLILGIAPQKLQEILAKQNHRQKVKVRVIGNNLLYLRNILAQNLKPTKQILKNLSSYLEYRYQKFRVVPISKFINVGIRDVQKAYQILYRSGCTNFESLYGNTHVLKFKKTFIASLAYIQLRDHEIQCQFALGLEF